MKKNVWIMILTVSILLGVTACSNYEPLVSGGGVATGSAVSGDSVNVVSDGAVKSNSTRDKENQSFQWSKWYRNCNSNKMYILYEEEDADLSTYLLQVDLNGGKNKKFKIRTDGVLWVTDESIYINSDNSERKVYRIPIKHGEDQQESLDTANQKCVISDLFYDDDYGDWQVVYAMDDHDIYYINKDKKLIAYNIATEVKKEVKFPDDANAMASTFDSYVTESKVFLALNQETLYCIHRDTLEVEKIDSCSKGDYYNRQLVYIEESDELYFIRDSTDSYGACNTEMYIYDGNTTRCVVSKKEMNDFLNKNLGLTSVSSFESYIYAYGGQIYIEIDYQTDEEEGDDHCAMLIYDRTGKLYEEEQLAEQIKKHFGQRDDDCYEVSAIYGDTMYISVYPYGEDVSCSYNIKTGEMDQVSDETINLMKNCFFYDSGKAEFSDC